MAQAVSLLVPITLFAIMFALGLGLPGDRFDLLERRPGLLLRALLGTCLLVPLVALVVLKLPFSEGLSIPSRYAIALMAVCPSAPLTMRKAGKTGGSRQLAAHLQVAAALMAILSIPLLAELFSGAFGLTGWDIGPWQVAGQIGKTQILPLACGLLLRRWRPHWANRWEGLFDKLANLLLLLIITAVLVKAGPYLIPFMGNNAPAVAVMVGMVVLSLAIGFLMAGPEPEERTTMSLVTSMRNPGLALLLAGIHAPTMVGLRLAILTYLLITVLVSVPFLQWRKRLVVAA